MSLSAGDRRDEEKALLPSASDRRDNWGSISGGGADHQLSDVDERFASMTLLLLMGMSLITTVVSAVLLTWGKVNNQEMVVDFASNLCDAIAYVASLVANYYVQGKSKEKKDSVEFWTAIFSTMLLYAVGAKIGFQCYGQMLCALDTKNHSDGTLRCSFWLERPDPKVVIFIEFFKFCLYVALSFLLLGGSYTVSIRKNVNLMSALLHCVVDLMQGVVFGIASLVIIYTKKTEHKVTIDATASIFALLVLIISTAHMWKDFADGRRQH
jgi:Co/Zn/Cd efflux system component